MNDLIYPEESYAIIGACFDVYNDKGCGFYEPVFHDCMEIELGLRQIPFVHETTLPLSYKGFPLKHIYSPDFTCWNKIVLELKAVDKLVDEHVAQVLNYLNATGYDLGLLVNFGHLSQAGVEAHRAHPTSMNYSRSFASFAGIS